MKVTKKFKCKLRVCDSGDAGINIENELDEVQLLMLASSIVDLISSKTGHSAMKVLKIIELANDLYNKESNENKEGLKNVD